MLKSKFVRNIGWIFFGNIIHAILQFALNVYVARIFSTDEYGLINYSASLIAFFSSIGTLGFNGVITKKFAEDEKHCSEYIGSGMIARAIFSILAIAALQLFVGLANDSDNILAIIVFCQSLAILYSAFDLPVYWFRYKNRAKTVALARLASFAVSAIWRILVLTFFKDIVLYIIGVSTETLLFVIALFILYVRENQVRQNWFSYNKLISMLKISYPFIFSAVLSTIYGQTDKIMLRSMVDNTAVAMYSVSLTLAGAIVIIPTALIEGFRPDIMLCRLTNKNMYIRRLKQLYALVFWVCISYCLFVTFFAKWIILLLYGKKYLDAISSLSIIVWYTSFSYFGSINNLYMVAENKTKWVPLTSILGAIMNIFLNYVLIPRYSVSGAAVASLITQIVVNFVILRFIPSLKENFYIICDAILLRGVLR